MKLLLIENCLIANKIRDDFQLECGRFLEYYSFEFEKLLWDKVNEAVRFWSLPRAVEFREQTVQHQGKEMAATVLVESRTKEAWYFAYGSNMDVRRMQRRVCASTLSPYRAFVYGYKIAFNKLLRNGSGAANICREDHSRVYGVAYPVTPFQLALLDRFEGVEQHQYRRVTVPIQFYYKKEQVTLLGITYEACSEAVANFLQPTSEYLAHILSAQAFLPPEYLVELHSACSKSNWCLLSAPTFFGIGIFVVLCVILKIQLSSFQALRSNKNN